MNRRGYCGLAAMAVLLAALFLLSSTDWFIKEKKNEVFQVAVLVDSADDMGWENFRMGMERAALDMEQDVSADISFVTLYDAGETHQQRDLLRREIEGGTQGVILAAENLQYQQEMLQDVPASVPVVVYGSAVDSPRVWGTVAPGLAQMAASLAQTMLNDAGGPGMQIAIVTATEGRADVDAILQALEPLLEAGGQTISRIRLTSLEEVSGLVGRLQAQDNTMVFAPELHTMLRISQEVEASGGSLPVYGFGWNGAVRQALDTGSLRAVAVSDGYDAGYLTVRKLIAALHREHAPAAAPLRNCIVTRGSVYNRQYETMLFPIS